MPLDVYLQRRREPPRRGDSEAVASFGDDGYYWFLLPLFEQLKRTTGQSIDLYGDAAFSGADLEELAETIAAARQLIEPQPEHWSVRIGTQTAPTRREIFSPVRKDKFEKMLLELEAAVARARDQNLYVTFWGD